MIVRLYSLSPASSSLVMSLKQNHPVSQSNNISRRGSSWLAFFRIIPREFAKASQTAREFTRKKSGTIDCWSPKLLCWLDSDCTGIYITHDDYPTCSSTQKKNIFIADNFFLSENFRIKNYTKKYICLKTPNLEGFLLTPSSFGDRSFWSYVLLSVQGVHVI